jgi:hypothetical protein
MAEVGPVKGPPEPPEEPVSGVGKKRPPGDAFKRIMKVEKVREVDAEEKRKRRERAEKEEPEEQPTTPAKEAPAPFSLEEEEKKVSPLEMQGKGRPSPMQPPPSAQPPPPPGEEEEISAAPSAAETPPGEMPPSEEEQPPPPSEISAAPTYREGGEERGVKEAKEKEKDRILFPEAPMPREEEKETFFKEFAPKEGLKEIEKEEKREEAAEIPLLPGEHPPSRLAVGKEKAEEKKVEEAGISSLQVPEGAAAPSLPLMPEAPSATPPAYAFLPPQMLDLFERMVGVMTVMHDSGITETTIHLTSEQFASSVFFGSQIIIKEFSTAPKEFNIQFNTTPQGATLFQANVDDLLAAFQSGNYAFRINRCETNILAERPLFRRKERAGGEGAGEQPR